jgi:hypothetical protein
MKTRTLLLATIAALALPMQGQTLLNDSFTDSEFLTQSLPNSAEWFRSLNAVSAANQNFAVTGLSGGITVAGFFGNTPHTLSNPGDGITLSFTFTTPNDPLLSNTGNGFRFALFNSAGDRFNTESGVELPQLEMARIITGPATLASCRRTEESIPAATSGCISGMPA